MESSQIDKIFETSVQTAIGRQVADTTGLELPISQAVMQLTGSEISVSSHVGKDSVFAFAIPVGKSVPPVFTAESYRCQIRADRLDLLPVIIAIGHCRDEADRSIALSAGCADFLCYPLHESQIRVTISKYLGLGKHDDQPAATPADLADLGQQLVALDRSWVANVHQATLEGDLNLMLALVDAICLQYQDLADTIAALTSSFQYVQLLSLTQITDSF